MSADSSLNASLPTSTTTTTKNPPQAPPTIPTLPYPSLANPAPHNNNQHLISLLRTHGFIRLTHHPIPPSLLHAAFAHSRAFFALPPAEKELAPHPPASTGVHRGYSRPGFESVGGTTKGVTGFDAEEGDIDINNSNNNSSSSNKKPSPNETDTKNATVPPLELKESFELGHPLNPLQPNIYPPPSLLPGWQEFMLDFHATLASFSHTLLDAIAAGLELSPDERASFLDVHTGMNDQLRLLCYPAISQKELGGAREGEEGGGVVRMPGHTDWSTITLLFTEQGTDVEAGGGGGLEVKSQDGTWIAAEAQAEAGDDKDGLNTVLVNVGDMLMRWTNGILPSAEHRVGLPSLPPSSTSSPASSAQPSLIPARFSIPYFVAADADTLVTPFASCVSESRPRRYVPVTQGEYGRVRGRGQFLE
ncbi:MAG: hypothetical protein M1824_002956 [Vezdaea acicularis]|nr:MAG: hypothetical protein M1824_002956 [Vezdaea acicularis]